MGRAKAGLRIPFWRNPMSLLKELKGWMEEDGRGRVKPFQFVLEEVGLTYVISMLPCQQLAPGSSHRDEQSPCEIRDDSTALLMDACSNTHPHTYTYTHKHACIAYIRHRGTNSDATTWSYRAPMMTNKQHFGWGETLLSTGWGERVCAPEPDTEDLGAF